MSSCGDWRSTQRSDTQIKVAAESSVVRPLFESFYCVLGGLLFRPLRHLLPSLPIHQPSRAPLEGIGLFHNRMLSGRYSNSDTRCGDTPILHSRSALFPSLPLSQSIPRLISCLPKLTYAGVCSQFSAANWRESRNFGPYFSHESG